MEEAKLLEWALANGITDAPLCDQPPWIGSSLAIATFPQAGGRGLAATRELKEGELILMVPENALLSVQTAKEDPAFMKALQLFLHLSPIQVLAALLLREVGKGSASRWYSYLRTLPRSYHTLAHFSTLEVQALQVEDAVWTAEEAVKAARKDWAETVPFLKALNLKSHLVTWKAWLWASSTVSSRTLHVPWSPIGTLCPVGDLFNYAPPGEAFEGTDSTTTTCCSLFKFNVKEVRLTGVQETEGSSGINLEVGRDLHFTDRLTDGGYDATAKAYCFYARKDYKPGDQVLLCYGLYTNLELLEHYGFILSNNPNDKVFVRLDNFSGFTPGVVPVQRGGLKQHGSMHIEVDGRPSFQLLVALRLQCATAEVHKLKGHLALCGEQLCIENDMAVYRKLKQECLILLGKCSTTMCMDIALMHVVSLCGSIEGLTGLLELLCSSEAMALKLLVDSICGWSYMSLSEQQWVLDELRSFLKSPKKKDLQRWWLSINWRLCHKSILHHCLSHCDQELLHLCHVDELC